MFGKTSDNPIQSNPSTEKDKTKISQSVPTMQGQKEQVRTMDKSTTLIAQGSNIKGTLRSDDTVQIDGNFEGEIDVKQTVNIGSSAVVKANITAGEVKISGRVDGNIDAKDRLEIMSTGKLFGDIKTPRLIIAEGVVFEGHCSMGTDKKPESSISQQRPKAATPVSV